MEELLHLWKDNPVLVFTPYKLGCLRLVKMLPILQYLLCFYCWYGACGLFAIYDNGDLHLITPEGFRCEGTHCDVPCRPESSPVNDNAYLLQVLARDDSSP